MLHQHVGQQEREGLVPDELARAPHRMAQPKRRLLAREARGAGAGLVLGQKRRGRRSCALLQGHFEFELAVEMVLDHALVAPGDEDEMLDAGLPRLVHHMWISGRSTTVSISFGMALVAGRNRVPRPGHGENSFTDGLHGDSSGQGR